MHCQKFECPKYSVIIVVFGIVFDLPTTKNQNCLQSFSISLILLHYHQQVFLTHIFNRKRLLISIYSHFSLTLQLKMSELLTTYRPIKILLQLDPNLGNNSYNGRVKIDYEFTGETSEIKIQTSRDFQWTSVRLATFYDFNEGCPVCKFLNLSLFKRFESVKF